MKETKIVFDPKEDEDLVEEGEEYFRELIGENRTKMDIVHGGKLEEIE